MFGLHLHVICVVHRWRCC